MRKTLISSLFMLSIVFSGPYEVGALVEDFSGEECFPENGDEWSLYDYLSVFGNAEINSLDWIQPFSIPVGRRILRDY